MELQALAILESEDPPSLALVDWDMPGIDGLEICRRLRCGNRRRSTYVILLTPWSQQHDRVEAQKPGLTTAFSSLPTHTNCGSVFRLAQRSFWSVPCARAKSASTTPLNTQALAWPSSRLRGVRANQSRAMQSSAVQCRGFAQHES